MYEGLEWWTIYVGANRSVTYDPELYKQKHWVPSGVFLAKSPDTGLVYTPEVE